MPGKTFEYMRTQKPILALGPENGEVARILNENHSGVIIDYDNYEKIYKSILDYFKIWQKNGFIDISIGKNISKYDRRELTAQLVKIFENIYVIIVYCV